VLVHWTFCVPKHKKTGSWGLETWVINQHDWFIDHRSYDWDKFSCMCQEVYCGWGWSFGTFVLNQQYKLYVSTFLQVPAILIFRRWQICNPCESSLCLYNILHLEWPQESDPEVKMLSYEPSCIGNFIWFPTNLHVLKIDILNDSHCVWSRWKECGFGLNYL
jgi:hypothetical protein